MILRIVKAGCHPVAIAQVVEHLQLKSEAPGSIPVAAGFSQFSKYFELSSCTCTCVDVHHLHMYMHYECHFSGYHSSSGNHSENEN